MRVDAPEKIVVKLDWGRLFEADHRCSLRIERGEYVLDRAVLAAGVQGLENNQDRVLFSDITKACSWPSFLPVLSF